MEIDLVFKIAAIGIIVAVLNQLLIRSGREDQAMMTTLAGLVVVLSILVKQISVTVRYHQVAVCTMSTSVSILGAAVVFAAAQLLLRKDAPAYAFLLSGWRSSVCAAAGLARLRRSCCGNVLGTQPPGGRACLCLSAALCRDSADDRLRPDPV